MQIDEIADRKTRDMQGFADDGKALIIEFDSRKTQLLAPPMHMNRHMGGKEYKFADGCARPNVVEPCMPFAGRGQLPSDAVPDVQDDALIPAALRYPGIALLQKAEATRRQLFSPANPARRPDREVERLARLAFLAPDIVTAILEGRQPRSLTPRPLLKYASVPLDWKSQRQALGF